jgi:hypothetical protein
MLMVIFKLSFAAVRPIVDLRIDHVDMREHNHLTKLSVAYFFAGWQAMHQTGV